MKYASPQPGKSSLFGTKCEYKMLYCLLMIYYFVHYVNGQTYKFDNNDQNGFKGPSTCDTRRRYTFIRTKNTWDCNMYFRSKSAKTKAVDAWVLFIVQTTWLLVIHWPPIGRLIKLSELFGRHSFMADGWPFLHSCERELCVFVWIIFLVYGHRHLYRLPFAER